jgi:hypothetical protein
MISRTGKALLLLSAVLLVGPAFAGLDHIAVTDDEIQIELSATGSVSLLEIEPYDTLNPLRGLVENRPDCQQLDLSNDGFLRMTFLNSSPSAFDPQIQFPDYKVNADYVAQFSMRVRVSGVSGDADMPFRVYGYPAYQDVSIPSDGEWHIIRADMTETNWNGSSRVLRLDPANAQGYSVNASAVLDIDWVAVTYRNDFEGDRNHTGLDVFIDLGVPEPSWSGTAASEIVLPRTDGVRDRLYAKYILTDGGTNQIGNPRFVTDLSGLSYQEHSVQNWTALNTNNGIMAPTVSDGVLRAEYQSPTGSWDPVVLASSSQRVDMDAAQEFSMKYRFTGYTGGSSTVPLALYGYVLGESGVARQDDVLIPDGEWHVYRVRLDQSTGDLTWHGDVRIRIDAPQGQSFSEFSGAALELDWVAVSDDALFTPSMPLCDGGRLWTFTDDRTAPLRDATGFKGLSGPVFDDFVDLGMQIYKMNFMQVSAMNTGLSPAFTWPVDEFDVGINTTYMNNTLIPTVKDAFDNNMTAVNTFLNRLEDYWIDEGTSDQRFNPLRNYLTSSNAPNTFSVAHNVMDPVGIAYYRGVLEYLGSTFSDPSGDNGEIYRFTIGNEVDAHWSWYNVGEIDIEDVVDIYLTSCRIADLALRSQNPNIRIYVSFTHYWDSSAPQGDLRAGKVKDFLDLFAAKAKEEGDFPWALCIHPYPVSLFDPVFWDDSEPTDDFDTEYITFKNLQVIRRYLQQESMLYNGQPRTINLGEQGFHVTVDGDAEDEAQQAAALAYSCKIIEQVPGVEAYLYHRQLDHSLEGTLRFGLGVDTDGLAPWAYERKRPSWYVMRDYGTTNETATFAPYLAYISTLSSWDDINLADIELKYHFDQPDSDFEPDQITGFDVSNGVCSGTVSGGDPKIKNLNVDTYGDGQESCVLRIKTAKTGNWQLFWARPGAGFAAARSILFPVQASDDFQIVSFDLSTNAEWCGQNIIDWRLDPVGATGGYDFEIDYMLFGPKDDFDGDGIADGDESAGDSDGDGLPDWADTDSNGNGWSDAREASNGWNPASADTDGDGMDNDWEIQYGLDPQDPLEADWDWDSDGFNMLAEHIADTDPADGLDFFVIDGVGEAVVSIDAKAGRTYTLRASTNLVSNVWKTVDTQSATQNGPLVLTDTNEFATAIYKVNVQK